jgi:hypothetical protein
LTGYFRRVRDSSNAVVGIIMLLLLLVFVGPNVVPNLLARTFPFVYEGAPCAWLRTANNRAAHQSLIGRAARDPLTVRVTAGPVPTTADGVLKITITIINNTIGTVPIVYDANEVIIGDDGSSGVGLLFDRPTSMQLGIRQTAGLATFPEAKIKLLGPRQRCVHTIEIPYGRMDPSLLTAAQTPIRAYYRITTAGAAQSINPSEPFIFPDQGLALFTDGYAVSEPFIIVPPPIPAAVAG